MKLSQKIKFKVILGFSLILAILAILTGIWLTHVSGNTNRLAKLVKDQQASEYIFTMRDVAHNRALTLFRLALLEDAFDRDSEFIHFSALAEEFIKARDNLLSLGITEEEKRAWAITQSLIRLGSFTQRNTADLIREFNIDEAKRMILEQVIPIQNKVMTHMTIMLDLKKQKVAAEIRDAAVNNRSVYISISVLGSFALFIAGLIALIVIKTTTESELALKHALEYAQGANQHKSLFLANMSHELRTPLNAIIGYAAILQEDAQDRQESLLASDLDKIHVAGHHLLSVINDILDLSKIEANKTEISPNKFSLNTLVEEVTITIKPMITENDNRFIVSTDISSTELYNDETKIRQSLLNLLSNASKFTKHGTIKFIISEFIYENNEWIKFVVADSGIGMSEGQIEKLFIPFTQADLSTTREFGGTGLGLTISKQYCEMLGGSIHVKSELSQGSVFTIQIPKNFITTSKTNLVA